MARPGQRRGVPRPGRSQADGAGRGHVHAEAGSGRREVMRAALALTLRVAAAAGLLALSGCSLLPASFGGVEKPKPAELQPDPKLIGVRQAWSAHVGTVDFPLVVAVSGNVAVVASGDGTVVGLDAATGREEWRGSAKAPLAAGVGFDGSTAAVITR